ncbi:hypothetical protein Pan216_07680 [Planctomycetes bacterium Pan216]|uniref:Uncharacterized protein n=1 Tax=Kolteria novifilia TaxID=2527975 RepID=A0A518AYX8_9BACT|nr:hypothetical protein Pan216_07680 [Planctomycetes bacterium Pan216]
MPSASDLESDTEVPRAKVRGEKAADLAQSWHSRLCQGIRLVLTLYQKGGNGKEDGTNGEGGIL